MRINLQDLRVILRRNNYPVFLRDNGLLEPHEVFFQHLHFVHQECFQVFLHHGGKLVIDLLTVSTEKGDLCVLEFVVGNVAGCVEFVTQRSVADKH